MPLSPSNVTGEGEFGGVGADGTIAAKAEDFVQFWKDGLIHYVSRTLRAGGDNIEGTLVKKSRSKLAAAS